MKKESIILKGLLTLFPGLVFFSAQAQTITVREKITDSNNEPGIGATIVLSDDASKGTISDLDGNWTLQGISPDAVLVFSYVGMKAQTVDVNSRTTINVTLRC